MFAAFTTHQNLGTFTGQVSHHCFLQMEKLSFDSNQERLLLRQKKEIMTEMFRI